MNKLLFLILIPLFSKAQILNVKIPDSITKKADAVVIENIKKVQILQVDKMIETSHREVLILNKQGLNYIDAEIYYNKSINIQNLEIKILNSFGKEIKKIKKKDMKDFSASGNSTFMSDNRILVLDYTPTSYPFTVVLDYEEVNKNTAFIPSWMPIQGYNVGILKDEFILENSSGINLNKKEFNFTNYPQIKFEEEGNKLSYSLSNYPALEREELAPSYWSFIPFVKFGLEHFYIEGVEGEAENWNEFGKWVNEKLLSDVGTLPEETKSKILNLVKGINDPIERAKVVYRFVQNKTRYISVQLGIGGWKPMSAENVSRLGYGDCKALTNYTKALLEVVDVPSYYTIIYAGHTKQDIVEDLVAMQGTHAILTIPHGDEYLFLECTSQTDPFNYQGQFTDDRKALIINKDGAKIIQTNSFKDEDNKQITIAEVVINETGGVNVEGKIKSYGAQFEKYHSLEDVSDEKKDNYYKDRFDYINNISFEVLKLNIDKDKIIIEETISFKAENYGEIYSNEIIFCPNLLNKEKYVSKRYKNRKLPFSFERGYNDLDEVIIKIPQDYQISGLPENIIESSVFGSYEASFELMNDNEIKYRRNYLFNRGTYFNTDYENYRKFQEKISKADNVKILITKK